MDDSRRNRIAVHEAAHAAVYFACGRPIVRAVVRVEDALHQVDPVPGTRIAMRDEGMGLAAGWLAEERLLRINGVTAEDELLTEYLSGGHHYDFATLDALSAKIDDVDAELEKHRAFNFVKAYWHFILPVAEALLDREELDQADMATLAAEHGVQFGECGLGRGDSSGTAEG